MSSDSINHTFFTIKSLLCSFITSDLPSFSLIITTSSSPIILCSDISTNMALNPKSGIWNSLFYFLQERNSCSDLASAIHAAYDIFRIGPSIRPNYTFVLTDGIYNKEEQYRISDTINRCIENGMNIFGVGIGNYPKGIESLFRQAIYSINADYLLKGISSFFGESLGKRIDTIPVIGIESN